MIVTSASFCLPKQGNPAEENEDACYPTRDGERQGPLLKLAVADGATVTLLSRQWARLLVKTFATRGWDTPDQFLAASYRSWERWTAYYFRKREQGDRPIAWFEEPGLSEGAFSTLLGVTLRDDGTDLAGSYTVVAVGDSCLFQIRDGELIMSFPHESSGGFPSRPYLISSRPEKNSGLRENLACCSGEWRFNDRFLLMTDALANWFIGRYEAGERPWEVLRLLTGQDGPLGFRRWITEQREARTIRNDDVTLISVLMGEEDENHVLA
ncbi:MAG: hypothetical protein HPY50_07365 [Firmicutes bacterium]|nr:hypothetical protein [Bacillota bacterium]